MVTRNPRHGPAICLGALLVHLHVGLMLSRYGLRHSGLEQTITERLLLRPLGAVYSLSMYELPVSAWGRLRPRLTSLFAVGAEPF